MSSISLDSSKTNGVIIKKDAWYRHPTLLWILKSTAINFILPFFNGVMLGFGEILANELMFKYGWFGYFSRPQLGLNGIPPSATKEYKKTVEKQIKNEEKKQNEEHLLLD
ncbi:outer membrane protein TOM13-domain-containing protein [Cokeromyces recurvatus]|uniref:outer membrane protein TOM13-domain-containing protein n=1 Tax=Cokeromyces recurvatus TaxID=90255 RepID=UPI00221EAE6A|nr:outer membrane protein TOM13-domain-containing protein [Cokeromyces recurvatus]KAI7897874.1 outer membrane protein TOM13-domain-containing protein [Cokeromyces recurvatus]